MHEQPTAYLSGTTRGLPPGQDYEHFCDAIADVYVGVRPERPESRAFAADFALYDLSPFSLGWIATPGVSAHRDRASLRTMTDDAVFLNHSEHGWGLLQHDRSWRARGGTALVLDNEAPFTVVADPRRPLRLASLRIPRAMLSPRARASLRDMDDRLAGSPIGAQLGSQIGLLVAAARSGMPGVARAMAATVLEMLDAAVTGHSGLPRRVEEMRVFVSDRLADPTLDLATVARAFRCSTRTVQAEFARDGTSFSAWLRAARLDRARATVRSADRAGRPIAAIAREHGFTDPGTFHRAYRARFGVTPGADR